MKKDRGWRHKFLEAYCLLKLPPASRKLIWHVVRQRLTYLSIQRLAAISKAVKTVGKSSSQVIFIEAGCALGVQRPLLPNTNPQKASSMFTMSLDKSLPHQTKTLRRSKRVTKSSARVRRRVFRVIPIMAMNEIYTTK